MWHNQIHSWKHLFKPSRCNGRQVLPSATWWRLFSLTTLSRLSCQDLSRMLTSRININHVRPFLEKHLTYSYNAHQKLHGWHEDNLLPVNVSHWFADSIPKNWFHPPWKFDIGKSDAPCWSIAAKVHIINTFIILGFSPMHSERSLIIELNGGKFTQLWRKPWLCPCVSSHQWSTGPFILNCTIRSTVCWLHRPFVAKVLFKFHPFKSV